MSDEDFRFDNPTLVPWESVSDERVDRRNEINRRLIEGVDAEELLFHSIDEARPSRFVAANITRAHLAASAPATVDEPVTIRRHRSIFVADKET